jgi:hypothetical protein
VKVKAGPLARRPAHHSTWLDGIPEILAEQRLGHQVPGIRGLYARVSQRMRDELTPAGSGDPRL